MKTKLTLITLIACAAAGTTFAADPVEAFRASSGTTTNSADTIYVGNDDWGADSKTLGEEFFADLAAERGVPFEWDESKKAFYIGDSLGNSAHEKYLAFDAVFALDGNASFVNEAGATLTFRFVGDKGEQFDDFYEGYTVNNDNVVLLAGTSKFSNAGTLLWSSEFEDEDIPGLLDTPPHFEVYMRDEAVFENSGKIGSLSPSVMGILRDPASFTLFGNAKFVNAANGEIDGKFYAELYGNSVFENAGAVVDSTADDGTQSEFKLHENAKVVNTGTSEASVTFLPEKGDSSGTATFENRGKIVRGGEDDHYGFSVGFFVLGGGADALPEKSSGTFVNYGEISTASDNQKFEFGYVECAGSDGWLPSGDAEFEAYEEAFRKTVEASDWHVKNFGTIKGSPRVASGVELTLGEGSNITGDVVIGEAARVSDYFPYSSYSSSIRLEKDVLNIVLTGKGGSDALISGGLEVCNLVELNVSLAEDAVKKTKYELTIWGGELTFDETDSIYDPETGEYVPVHHDSGFIKTTGTLEGFGTTYTWNLDTATGVLTAKDVNIGEEIDLTSPTQNVELGEKDVATLDPSLTEYSGTVSGAGQVSSSGDVEFSGDASALTGTLSVDAGTFTVAESAKLGEKATLDVAGTLALEGDRTIANATSGAGAIELAAGATVKFAKEVGVKTLNVSEGATLSGGVSLTHAEAV
ncbi:MAG TPA: hypothetical protein IAC75_03795, partial [Candidatus Spyradosoma merdigallinarum]|nr:hypothetical protein [Candidatus Spyradosoma merdigallinarum]